MQNIFFTLFSKSTHLRQATLGLMLFCSSALLSLTLKSPWKSPLFALFLLGTALLGSHLARHFWRALPFRAAALLLVVTHGCALAAFPVWSDDIYRYIYEGRALRSGLSAPYAIPPESGIQFIHDEVKEHINHPDIPASYPPFWQFIGSLLAYIGDALQKPYLPFRLFFLSCDLIIALLLLRKSGRRGFYNWMLHPLPFIELAHGAHLDALGVVLLLASVVFFKKHLILRGLFCGLAIGIKPIAAAALFALPILQKKAALSPLETKLKKDSFNYRRWFPRRDSPSFFIFGMFLGVAVPTVPFLLANAPIFKGLSEYSQRWEAQPTGFALLRLPLASTFKKRAKQNRYAHAHFSKRPFGLLLEENGQVFWQTANATFKKKPLLIDDRLIARSFALFLMLSSFIWLLFKHPASPRRAALVILCFFAFAPAVHPWYLLWPLPLVLVSSRRDWLKTGLWWAAALAPLAYQAVVKMHLTGTWQEAYWPRVFVLIAFFTPYFLARFKHGASLKKTTAFAYK